MKKHSINSSAAVCLYTELHLATKPSKSKDNYHLRKTGCLLPNVANAGRQQSHRAASVEEDIHHGVE
jgi:hypothetical protein